MKCYLVRALFLSVALVATLVARERVSLNEDWLFYLGDIEIPETKGWERNDLTFVYEAGWDVSDWSRVNLPHDWMIELERSPDASGLNAFFPGGVAWYRKDFVLPAEDAGKHIEIQFDGVYRESTVWVNGYLLGTQYDGYTSFYHDISEMVAAGEINTIVVRVDVSGSPVSRWYSGAGIYRNVWLLKTNDLHVKTWGTAITTLDVGPVEATVVVKTELENLGRGTAFKIETRLIDREGKVVGKLVGRGSVDAHRSCTVEQQFNVSEPKLWSLNSPVLYQAISVVWIDGKVVDEHASSFGIRSLKFDAEAGFFLNGNNLKMKGVCLHHAAGNLGAAVPVEVWERRLRKLKEMGCNAVRTAHNPMAPEFLDLCDRLGFLVMDEFVDKWSYWGPIENTTFRNEWRKNFSNTICRDRNHPSVIIWSVGNENFACGSMEQNQGLREYITFVHDLDPTRPVVSGMERGFDAPVAEKVADILESCSYMDLVALNYGEQWCSAIHEARPGEAFVSTESYRYYGSLPEERHAMIVRSPWLDVLDNDFNIGLFLWAGIDYLGEVGAPSSFPRRGSTSALLDFSGMRKECSYLYEAFWSEKPMVRIARYVTDSGDPGGVNNWVWPQLKGSWEGASGEVVDLVTYTNCEEVELYLNDRLVGVRRLEDCENWIMNWEDLPYEQGVVRAVGRNNGEVVCSYELKTPGEFSSLELFSDKRFVEPGGIVQVEVCVRDEFGTLLVDESPEVEFEISGGEVLALENADPMYGGPFTDVKHRKAYRGSVLCVLKAGAAGEVELKVRAAGGIEEVLRVEVVEQELARNRFVFPAYSDVDSLGNARF